MRILAQLHQEAEGGLGVEEGYQSPVGPFPGGFIDEPHARGLQFRHRGVDILHFQGQVMEALALVFQELGHCAVRRRGQEQFQLAFAGSGSPSMVVGRVSMALAAPAASEMAADVLFSKMPVNKEPPADAGQKGKQ